MREIIKSFLFILTASACVAPALAAPAKKKAEPVVEKSPQEILREQMLAHVEQVLVVDSINVDKEAFFKRYKLQPSTGSLLTGAEVAAQLRGIEIPDGFEGAPLSGFTNEYNDYLLWAQPDSTGFLRLAESVRLVDGSWSSPQFAPLVLNNGDEDAETATANAAFPFMSDDGQTLYYASDNPLSLGGYDIFVATKDPSDGEYLIPGNLGMPFNSEFDDYMMVLDRQTGVGWWATDRNLLDDQLTIYVYALTDERDNVDPDDENLLAYASLQGWETLLTDEQKARRDELLRDISSIQPPKVEKPAEFHLPGVGGKTYTHIADFRNPQAATLMKRYLKEEEKVEADRKKLALLRETYYKSGSNRQTGTQIATLEEQLRTDEQNLLNLLYEVYRLESGED